MGEAIGSASTAIFLLSPAYTASEWCGKELTILQQRDRLRDRAPATGSPAVIPILWRTLLDPLPESLRERQLTSSEFPEVYASEGLLYLIRLRSHRDAYQGVLVTLGRMVADAIRNNPLPALSAVPPLSEIANAFAPSEATPGDDAAFGPTTAILAVVGGTFQWKPFETPVGALAHEVAARLLIRLQRRELADPEGVEKILDSAGHNGNPVLLIIDPGSVSLPTFATVERALVKRMSNFVALIAAGDWKSQDEAAQRIVSFFSSASVAHKEVVTNEGALRNAIEVGLSKARSNIIFQTVPQPISAAERAPEISWGSA